LSDQGDIANRVEELITPYVTAHGLEVVEVEYHQPGRGRGSLRIFLDRPGGITLDEITRMSRVIGELLDVHDVIGPSYTLEVSSPGLTRELKGPKDFARFAGRKARITSRRPLAGRQVHRGTLKGLEGEMVLLEVGGELTRLPLAEIAKARLDW
jgi:ribosome maturation factor RimP